MDNKEYRSGFVGLIGRPNVGKSTLMNRVVGQKIAIMSDKPQTTRNKIQGIYTSDEQQIVFVDTPGIHKPKNDLDQYMDQSSFTTFGQVDCVLFLTEPEKIGPGDRYIAEMLEKITAPVFLVINKIDLVHPDDLLDIINSFQQIGKFAEIIPISATQGNNIEDLLATINKYLPVGPKMFDEDQITDRPEYFVVGELIREQILHLTQDEIPHSTAVIVEQMKQRVNGKLQIDATIYVERSTQKPIVIGRGGAMLKQIGINSRREIEELLGEKINLKLWVKVQKNWRKDSLFLSRVGYNLKDL